MYKVGKNMTKVFITLLLAMLPMCSLGGVASASRLVKPTAPEITYGGRWVKFNDKIYRTGRGAAYLEANFTGNSIGVFLDDKNQEIFWLARIDNGHLQRFQTHDTITPLGNELGKGNHKLLLIRDTEGMAGNTDFGGLVLAKDGKILPASALPKYKLEFLGDSITAGAYNLGRENEEYPTYMAAESSYLAFGPKLARLLGAEYSVIAASGEGVLHNCGEFGYTSDCHATDNYLRSYYNTPSPAWQETGREPDAIILNHGANDFIDYPTLDKEVFTKSYQQLLETIRSKHPKSAILCVGPVPPAEDRLASPLIAQAVQAMGDKNMYYVPLNKDKPLLLTEDYGSDKTHPLARGHEKIVSFLYPILNRILK